MSGGAVIAIRQNEYIRCFRRVSAISPDTAVHLNDIGCQQSWIFQRMTAGGVFVSTPDGRWYLDEVTAESFFRRRQRVAILALAAFVVVIVVIMLAR